jgi:hypothetical protein
MNKIAIYTALVGNYDSLMQPAAVDPEFDYICFSDCIKGPKVGVWEIRPIHFTSPNSTRMARYAKLQPHAVLPEYEYSVWMDANILIKGEEFYEKVNAKIAEGAKMAFVPHPSRDCVYEEIAQCYRDVRIGFREALRQRRHLLAMGYPEHWGLMETNVVLRRHCDPDVVRISNDWWKELQNYTFRDQLSQMPVCWKEGLRPELLLGEGNNARNVPYLEVVQHSGRQQSDFKGLRRLPKKVQWTFRRIVARLFL